MSKTTRMFAKGGIAIAAVSAMALAGASPAHARDRDKIDAGDVIAGALIIGGIAAIASAGSKDRYRDGNRYRHRDHRYGPGNSERAVRRCVRAVERDARRAGFRYAEVTEVRDVDRERRGWEVTGRLVVNEGHHRGYRGDRYRVRYDDRRDRYRDLDRGRFKCEIRRGRIVDIDYKGIRGLG